MGYTADRRKQGMFWSVGAGSLPLLLIWVLAVTAARASELRRPAVPQA